MSVAVVSGVGESHPVRRSSQTAETLVLDAITAALQEAELKPADIRAIVTESSLTADMAPVDRVATAAGLHNVCRVQQSSPVGAGILGSVAMAFDLVNAGEADHCLVYFGVDWGTTPEGPSGYHERMAAKRVVEAPAGFAGPPLYFAVAAKRYQHVYGLSDAELQELLWSVANAARWNASHNPHAQNRTALTRDQYLAQPFIAEPLRSADCSLLSDGAIAIIVSRADRAPRGRPHVSLAGWAYDMEPIADMDFYTQSPWLPRLPAASRAAERAFGVAGLSPQDISVYALYDCFSIAVVLQLEAIGMSKPGEGGRLIANGALRFDGALPTNTHGGLLAHGYLLGAGHVVEAIRQLQHVCGTRQVRDARTAFVGAGPGRQYSALILRREGA